MHLVRIVQLIRAPRHAVELADSKRSRQSVLAFINVRDGDDAACVVELVKKEKKKKKHQY
jgi:hypothetical protein